MNPDNPNFRTPEEEARAAELVRLKAEISSLKARLSMTNSNWPHEKGLQETIALQARVIEKLKSSIWLAIQKLEEYHETYLDYDRPEMTAVPMEDDLLGIKYHLEGTLTSDEELEAIEQGEGM